MLAVRRDDGSDVGDVEVALHVSRFMNLIVFCGDAIQSLRLFGRETSKPIFYPLLVSRFE